MIRDLTGIPLIIMSHNAINLEKPIEQKDQIRADLKVSNAKHDIAVKAPVPSKGDEKATTSSIKLNDMQVGVTVTESI